MVASYKQKVIAHEISFTLSYMSENLMDKYYHNVLLKRINISLHRACNITINMHTHFRL